MRVNHALRLLLPLLLVFAVVTSAKAGPQEIATIKAVLGSDKVDAALFSPGFLAAVPETQLQPVIQRVRGEIGPVLEVKERDESNYLVETATHEMPVQIALDAEGQIAGLLFRPSVAKGMDVPTLVAEMQALAPQFSLLVVRDGEVLHAVDADTPLAVGSAFKLGVLKVLADDIAAGRRRWDDVVRLESGDISLPSGVMQTWPVGSPLTLHTLAAQMISISDNTATDALLRVVGRAKVEAVLGIAPVISTRELFTLKANPELNARYRAGDLAARRAILQEVAALPLPGLGQVGTPFQPEIEWLLSARKLCDLISAVDGLDVVSINPGVAERADWQRVAFKGGGEIGVLNLTTEVTDAAGVRTCIAATWNGPKAIDEQAATARYAGLLTLLKQS